jgi:hypothetical protein
MGLIIKPYLFRVDRNLFAQMVAGISIPWYFNEVGNHVNWSPLRGISVGKHKTSHGWLCPRTVNAGNFFHELAHVAQCALTEKLDKLLYYDYLLMSPDSVSEKTALGVLEYEAVAVGIQAKLAEHYGFRFDPAVMFRNEAQNFLSFRTLRGPSVVDCLSLNVRKPKDLNSDSGLSETMLSKLRANYERRLLRAAKKFCHTMIKNNADRYSISEILDALGKAECYLIDKGRIE